MSIPTPTLERPRSPHGVARLRDAVPSDAEALTLLEESANVPGLQHVFPADRYPFPVVQVRDRWTRELADPTYRIRVAEVLTPGPEGGRERLVAGYCACRVEGGDVWLEHLGVAPRLQGSGLGRLLVAESRGHFTDRPMRLWCLVENHGGRRFYEREGFRATGREELAPYEPYPPMIEYLITT